MSIRNGIDWRLTFVLDAAFLVLLISLHFGWFLGLILVEFVMWLIRLIWLSPMMLFFILRRLAHMVPIILIVVALGFALIQLAPGDAFSQMALNPDIRPQDLAQFRHDFGLDQPWYVQFFRYIWNALHGDFGFSVTLKGPVFALVSQRAGATVMLALTSLLLAWGFSIPAGIFAATHQYKWQDQTSSVVAFVGLAIPNFFLAFLLLYLISSTGNWLPLGGMTSVDHSSFSPVGKFFDIVHHMILPVFVIATSATAGLTRIMRANMLDVMNQQYIVTARAKGQSERRVVFIHALRNAINPMITILGFQLGDVLAGAALVEIVLAWPGLGQLILQALLNQDLYLVVGSLVYSVALLILGNLAADILLATVDPRVRIG